MTDKKDEALKLALEALVANDLLVNGDDKNGGLVWCMDGYYAGCFDIEAVNKQTNEAITAIREALAEQPAQQEPVAKVAEVHMSRYTIEWTNGPLPEGTELYTSPPASKPLTDEEIRKIGNNLPPEHQFHGRKFARAIEAKLREKNT